jgi:hypothetical protein
MDKHNDRKDLELTVREIRNAVKTPGKISRQQSAEDDGMWFPVLCAACFPVPTIKRS